MKTNFSNIDMYDRPILILKRADGTPIGVLGNATNVEINPKYNELSTLSFNLPSSVNGEATPFYDDVSGQKIVELKGIAQFVLSKPEESGEKVHVQKTVQANSLESEFSRKKITLPESTYKFFDNSNTEGTILGMIMELMPTWTVGTVDETLINKYRTFSVSNENLYNFMKGTAQKSYNCIFDFDTLNRVVHARDADQTPADKQVYISRDNLAKDIKVTENTDDMVTRLDVNGADGVDIREVNPTGSNQIIDLDYFMNTANFEQELIDKYNAWKQLIADNRLAFYNYSLQYSTYISEGVAENAKLADLKGEYTSVENLQAVIIQGIAAGQNRQEDLDRVNADLAAKQTEIDSKQAEIERIYEDRDQTMSAMIAIRDACAFDAYFTEAEIRTMDPYIIDNSIEETSFVASDVSSYTDGAGNSIEDSSIVVTGAEVTSVTTASGTTMYSVKGGTIDVAGIVDGDVVSAVFEERQDGKVILSIYVSNGSYSGTTFPSGCVSISGTGSVAADETNISCDITNAYLFFSLNASEYEKRTVAWELYEYGETTLKKMAVPSYTFSITSANFISLDEFELFKNELELGQRIYVQTGSGRILKPICTSAKIKYSDRPTLELTFSDTFTANDGESKLVDILGNSVSMGKTLSSSKYTYEAWTGSGASSDLHDFITSALDTSKNAILSSTEQAITWDGAGFRIRKYSNAAHTAYDPEQIWINNNSIMMTKDGWAHAAMAIGKIHDDNVGDKWGIIAEWLVGTMIAGEALVIESQKKDGGTAVFRMDSEGCRLYNSEFTIQKTNGDGSTTQILLDPETGIAIGTYPVLNEDGTINTDNAKFYVDASGNLHLSGTIIARDGDIGGWTISQNGLYSGDTDATRVGLASTGDIRIWAGNLDKTLAPFYVKQDGTMHSHLGEIGGWYIGEDYIGNENTKAASTTGMASGDTVGTITFWAGGPQASAKYRVGVDGSVYCSDIEIAGGSIVIKDGNREMFKVTSNGKVTAEDITINGGSITIKDNSVTKFQVTNKGKVTINNGSITIKSGDTTNFSVSDQGYMTSISGKIGGWHIGSNYLGNANSVGSSTVGLYSNTETATNVVMWAGGAQNSAPFRVTAAGKIYASDLDVSGARIGGWYTGNDYIGNKDTKAKSTVGLSAVEGDNVAIWAGGGTDPSSADFRVKANGYVYAKNMNINGGSITIKNGNVTKFEVTSTGKVTAHDMHIDGGDITLGTTFSVNSSGYLTASSGKIGGWFIGSDYIGSASTKATSTVGLSNVSSGNVIWAGTDKFTVTAEGKVTAKDLDINGGSITIGTVFSVNSSGVLTAKSGSIGGWYFLTDYLGNANTKAGSTVGISPVASNSESSAFWAGGAQNSATFRVEGNGKLHATGADISGTINATALSINGTGINTWLGSQHISMLVFDQLGGDSGITITPTLITLASTGKLVINSGNFTLDASGNGKIGGWSFTNVRFHSGSGRGYVAMDSDSTLTDPSKSWNADTNDWVQPYAFWCGNSNPTHNHAKFRVRRDGRVYISALMVWNGSTWEEIDFSGNFNNAVSYASGSWSGQTFTATLSLWGKINKTVSLSASYSVTGTTYKGVSTNHRITFDIAIKMSVGGATSGEITQSVTNGVDATTAYNIWYAEGYNDAIDNMRVLGTVYTITAHSGEWVKVSEVGTGYQRPSKITP